MRHPVPPALRLLLMPLWAPYRLLVALRTALYRRGILATHRLPVPVVAIGNLTVGGSGKTPITEYVARAAVRAGLAPAVISRGYGRKGRSALLRLRAADGGPALPEFVGDEPCWLASRNPELPVYLGRSRAAAGRLALAVDRPGLIVLDDAYQHLALARDLNVLLIDAEGGLGNRFLLPWGILREPLSALARADLILITKAGLGDAEGLARWLREKRRVRAPIFRCDYRPRALHRLEGGAVLPPTALRGRQVSLISAIARPGGFAAVVEGLGATVREARTYADHHPYTPSTLAELEPLLAGAGADPEWVTTEKDAVKLRGRIAHPEKLWVLEMEVVPDAEATAFFFDFLSGLPIK